jgi:ATP synthase protein I
MAKPWKAYGRYGSVGIELVLSILIGLWLGRKGDAHFGTAPWLTLLGLVAGAYAGFRALFATTKRMEADVDRAERAERDRYHYLDHRTGEDPPGEGRDGRP